MRQNARVENLGQGKLKSPVLACNFSVIMTHFKVTKSDQPKVIT